MRPPGLMADPRMGVTTSAGKTELVSAAPDSGDAA
jgi:hypothetical protein